MSDVTVREEWFGRSGCRVVVTGASQVDVRAGLAALRIARESSLYIGPSTAHAPFSFVAMNKGRLEGAGDPAAAVLALDAAIEEADRG